MDRFQLFFPLRRCSGVFLEHGLISEVLLKCADFDLGGDYADQLGTSVKYTCA